MTKEVENVLAAIFAKIPQEKFATLSPEELKAFFYNCGEDIQELTKVIRKHGSTEQKNLLPALRLAQNDLKDLFKDISTYDSEEFDKDAAEFFEESFLEVIEVLQECAQEEQSEWQLIRTERYNRKLRNKTYRRNMRVVESAEEKIFICNSQNRRIKNIKKETLSGPYAGAWHAWVAEPLGNHRIVYEVIDNEIHLLDIDTHKKLGID